MRINKTKNIVSNTAHYAATAGLAGLSLVFGQTWALAVGAVGVISFTGFVRSWQKHVVETEPSTRPLQRVNVPNLPSWVAEFHNKAGLPAPKGKVQAFNTDKPRVFTKEGLFDSLREGLFAAQGPQHSYIMHQNPVVMVSRRHFSVLNEQEQKALVARQFAKAAGKQYGLFFAPEIVTQTMKLSNYLTMYTKLFEIGVKKAAGILAGSLTGAWLVQKTMEKLIPEHELLSTKDEKLSRVAKVTKDRAKSMLYALGSSTSAAIVSAFSPAFGAVWATSKALNIGLHLTDASFRRSMEYQADRVAVELGTNPLDLISAICKTYKLDATPFQNEVIPESCTLSKIWAQATATIPSAKARVVRLADMARKAGYKDDVINGVVEAVFNPMPTNVTIREVQDAPDMVAALRIK